MIRAIWLLYFAGNCLVFINHVHKTQVHNQTRVIVYRLDLLRIQAPLISGCAVLGDRYCSTVYNSCESEVPLSWTDKSNNVSSVLLEILVSDWLIITCQSIGLTQFSLLSARELWSEHWPDRL
eukprot:sb/3475859/